MYVYTSSLFRFQTIRDIISTHVSLEHSCVFVCLHFRLKETNVNQSNSEGNILFFFTPYLSFSLSISFYTLFRLLQCNVSNVLCDFILYIYIYNKFCYITHVVHEAKLLFALVKTQRKTEMYRSKEVSFIHLTLLHAARTHRPTVRNMYTYIDFVC